VSGCYDLALGQPLVLAAPAVAALFGAPPPVPVINAELNGVFAATDGTLALATLVLLLRRAVSTGSTPPAGATPRP
jgi:hypothetical protein